MEIQLDDFGNDPPRNPWLAGVGLLKSSVAACSEAKGGAAGAIMPALRAEDFLCPPVAGTPALQAGKALPGKGKGQD